MAAASVEEIELNGREGAFQLAAETAPSEVVLDPNVWVMMQEPKFGKQATPQ